MGLSILSKFSKCFWVFVRKDILLFESKDKYYLWKLSLDNGRRIEPVPLNKITTQREFSEYYFDPYVDLFEENLESHRPGS